MESAKRSQVDDDNRLRYRMCLTDYLIEIEDDGGAERCHELSRFGHALLLSTSSTSAKEEPFKY